MLRNCIEIFESQKDTEKLVLDTYIPADGDYIIYHYENNQFVEQTHLRIKQDRTTRKLNITIPEQMMIAKLDYNCKLLEMNKPIDPKKIIQSNNYLSFWIKKENMQSGKLTIDVIDKYYEILANPYIKYNAGKAKELYQSAEQEVGQVNQDRLSSVKDWIKQNIFSLPYELEGKDYLKLFFLFDDVSIEQEGKRYYIPNVYNKNDYNQKIGDQIYGVPNNNMQMNAKKPFLEYKNRKQKVPVLEDTQNVMVKKLFFDYLMNCAADGKYNVYLYKEKPDDMKYRIQPFGNKEFPEFDHAYGYYLRISKDKNEAAIEEMDEITGFHSRISPSIHIVNCTEVNADSLKEPVYGTYYQLKEINRIMNAVLFSGYLAGNYFTGSADLKGMEPSIKRFLLLYRRAFFDWFYKGSDRAVRQQWDRLTMDMIKYSLENGYFIKVNHLFNIRIAVMDYFKGGSTRMADVMLQARDVIRDKINVKEYVSIESDEEYYYAVGQLVSFLLSKNKSKRRDHSLLNSFLNLKTDKMLKDRLTVLLKKYSYAIDAYSRRFNQLLGMVVAYQPEAEKKQDYLIAGYISPNLIYEKEE